MASGSDRPTPYSTATSGGMRPDELDRFLARPILARLATSLRDRPRVLPMWFEWDGRDVWMETSPTFPNARILRANPHAALTIDETDGGLRFRAVVMRGTVEVIDGPTERVAEVVRRIYVRYLGAEGLEAATPRRMLADPHVLIRFRPGRIITWDTTTTDLPPLGGQTLRPNADVS